MIDTDSSLTASPVSAIPRTANAALAQPILPVGEVGAFADDEIAERRPFPIAGVDFHLVTPETVLQSVLEWRSRAARHSISLVNPHSVLLCRRDPEMRSAISNSGLTLPDGIGIVLGARMLSYPHYGRVSGPELMLYLCGHGRAHGLRHFFYGGGEGVAQTLAQNLQVKFPGLLVAGTHTPPFRQAPSEEDAAVLEQINLAQADILWVGLGAPKQEKWIERNRSALQCSSVIGVGAAFDFHSGQIPWCPAPVRRIGLEWAYRLFQEPARLWRRNLDSFTFLAAVAGQRVSAALGRPVHSNRGELPLSSPASSPVKAAKAKGMHA